MEQHDDGRTTPKRTRIAVMIDADNASPAHAEALFAEIARLGEAVVRRIYGDFTRPNLAGWSRRLSRHALMPIQTVAYTTGKNSSDIALVIDAMDLLHSGLYDAFCLVSSDSDFARLAQRLREQGAEVYGFGETKTPESFRQSCRRFFLVENLAKNQTAARTGDEPALPLPTPAPTAQPASAALAVIRQGYERHVGDSADGWVPIRMLRRTISNIAADFDERTYGAQRLGDLAVATGCFEVRQVAERGWWLKLRDDAAAKPAPAPRRRRPRSRAASAE